MFFWESDGLVQRCYAEDFKTVGTPTEDDKSLAISHKLLPLDPACSDRVKTGNRLSTGDYVQSKSVYSRFGDQVGLVTGVVEGDLVVKWQHIKGHKPKDSRRSFQRKFWGDADLVKADPNWVECYTKSSKKK